MSYTVKDFEADLEHGPYAWPGGYPCFFITSDGAALSFEAALAMADEIREAIRNDERSSGWRVEAMAINWEDDSLFCDHTGRRIESAYAEPEEDADPA